MGLKLMPPPLRKSKAPSGRRKKRSMGPKSKRQKMAPMVPETEPQLKKTELVKKRKVRAKKTLTKKPKEKREKKRKMVRAKKKRKEMTKFLFLLSPNLVISYYIYQIRHLVIISALLTKKRGKKEIDCVSSKYTPIQRFEKRPKNPYPTREMPDQSSLQKKRPNISLENEQKYCQEMVFSLKKTKKNPFFPL